MSTATIARNAGLNEIADLLRAQHTTKHDAVVPAHNIMPTTDGGFVIEGMGPDGPVGPSGVFSATEFAVNQLATRLNIPVDYLRRCKDVQVGMSNLWMQNLDGWLSRDTRKFLVRSFVDPSSGRGVVRAFLSDSYKMIDNLDVLMAVLDGIRSSGIYAEVEGAELTETRMSVRIVCPGIGVSAPKLLEGYTDPFRTGRRQHRTANQTIHDIIESNPQLKRGDVVWAGLAVNNSEVGQGRFTIAPRAYVLICRNGQVMAQDAVSAVHLGAKMEEGRINWSDDTRQRNIELVASQARDAVTTFLDAGYLQSAVDRLEKKASKQVENPVDTIQLIGNQLNYSQEAMDGILNHFILGGQMTTGGILQAVSSYAQEVDDADAAIDLEATAVAAMEAAYAL